MVMVTSHNVHPLPEHLRSFAKSILEEHGTARGARLLGLSRLALLSVVMGRGATNGTRAILELAFQEKGNAA